MVRRHELTEQAWQQIQPLLPATGRPGRQWADHRRVLNGILWKLATGVPRRDLPARYGPWQTCYERFRRWQVDGTFDRLLAHAHTESDASASADKGYSHPPAVRCCAGAGSGTPSQSAAIRSPVVAGVRQQLTWSATGSNVVERCVNRRKHFRAVATRYDKLAASYRAWVVLAALLMWLP